jgi:DNA polymerase III subunit delta'
MIEWVQKWLVDLSLSVEGVPVRYFVAREREIQALSAFCALPEVIAFSRKAIQYRLECEQPLNSRLFLENFFLNYARLFRTHREGNG